MNRDFAYHEIDILDALGSLPPQVTIPETPIWSYINGPDMNLFQQLRLDRNIAYRKIEILVAFVSFSLDIAIRETPTRAIINGLDSFLIQWL